MWIFFCTFAGQNGMKLKKNECMKKLFTEIAFVAVTACVLFSGCRIYNPPDNPWTNHAEGTKGWFDDLTTGDEKDAIREYDVKNFIGIWQLAATTETSMEGEINKYRDWIVNSELSRGYTQRFIQLYEDMSCTYSFYRGVNDGTPGLRTTNGTWLLSGGKILFRGKALNSAYGDTYWSGENEDYIVELVEQNRLVFKHPSQREGKDVIYYEVYQRVASLPEVTVKSAYEKLTGNPWKVVNDSIFYYGYISPKEEGGETVRELAYVDVNTLLAGSVLHFDKDGKLHVTDKDGAEAVYGYEVHEFGSHEECEIHILSEEDPFHTQYGYLTFSMGIHEESRAIIRTSGIGVPEERKDPKYESVSAWLQMMLEKN